MSKDRDIKEEWVDFGKKITELRQAAGFAKQKDLAKRLAWHESKLSGIVNAKIVPNDSILSDLEEVFPGSADDLRALFNEGKDRWEVKQEWVEFGARIRELRQQADKPEAVLAEELGWQEPKVWGVINARVAPTDQDVAELELVFPGSGLRELYEQCRGGRAQADADEAKIRQVLQPFLLRVEMRLSTLHRTATCLLGGAAIMLLLPLFFPGAPAQLLTAVEEVARASVWSAILLATAMGITLGIPIWGFILIVADLTGFFFTGQRQDIEEVTDSEGGRVFNPRLGLSGLRAPAGATNTEALPGWAYNVLREKELAQLDVLLPEDKIWRDQFDDRMRQIFALDPERLPLTDQRRLSYAFRLSVSTPRPILDEVAKAELTLAKHILLLRVGLMRFIKTLLLVPVTVLTVISATVLVQAATDNPVTLLVALIAVFLLWGPLAVGAVGSPNRWIMRMSPGPGVVQNVYDDPRMVRFENGVVFLALVSSGLLVCSAMIYVVIHFGSAAANTLIFIVAANVVLWVITKWRWWKGYVRRTPIAFVRMLKVGSH